MRRPLFIGIVLVACVVVAAGLVAQSAGGPNEYGPFFCESFCNLARLDPGSGTTIAEQNTMKLLNEKSAEYNMGTGDTVIVCNGINCAVYKKSASGHFSRQKIEKEISSPPDSPEPPSNGNPVGAGHNGSGIPLTYWPTSHSSCVKATVEGPGTSSTVVYCG
jgi:hypothetical protein